MRRKTLISIALSAVAGKYTGEAKGKPVNVQISIPDDDGLGLTGVVPITVSVEPLRNLQYVRILLDGTIVNEDSSAPFGYTWDTTASTNGTHIIEAIAQYKTRKSTARLVVSVNNQDPPPPPPAGNFGADVPKGLPEPTGPVVNVTTDAQLRDLAQNAAPNMRVVVPAGVTIAGSGDIYFRPSASIDAPVLFDIQGAITGYASVYLTGQHIIMRGEVFGVEAVRPTTTGRYIVLDKMHIHDVRKQGVLTSSGVGIWQIRDSLIERCGEELNYDHNIYAATGILGCCIVNTDLRDAWAYNLQLYPNPNDCLISCLTIDGGQIQPENRGGIVLGGESSGQCARNRFVGIVGTNAPYNGVIRINQPLAPGNEMHDSVGWGNSEDDYELDPNIKYVNCIHGDPMYVNRAAGDLRPRVSGAAAGLIRPENFRFVTPKDRLGVDRVIRPNGGIDAGAYVAV